MKHGLRILKILLVIADAEILFLCASFALNHSFQQFIYKSLGALPGLSETKILVSSPANLIPSWTEAKETQPILQTPTDTPGHSESAPGDIEFNIPTGNGWKPVSYSFAYPSLVSDIFFHYGERDLYPSGQHFYFPDAYIEFEQLNPQSVLEGINIYYISEDPNIWSSVKFEQYLLSSETVLRLNPAYPILEEEDGISCVRTKHPNPPMEDLDGPFFYCYRQVQDQLILISGEHIEPVHSFLSDYLGGKFQTGKYLEYFPSLVQFASLLRQIRIAGCQASKGDGWYRNLTAGDGDNRKIIPLDIITNVATLDCTIYEEGMHGVKLTIVSFETRWMMDCWIDANYTRDSLDATMRNDSSYHIYKEGLLIVRYTDQGGIWISKQVGNSVLTLETGHFPNYRDENQNPMGINALIETLKTLASRIDYPEIDITDD